MVHYQQPFVSLRQAMDQLFNESFVGGAPFRTVWSRGDVTSGTSWSGMPLDIYATNDEVVVLAAVPGVHPDNLVVSYHEGTLLLSGTLSNLAESEETQGATWYLRELPAGAFRRAVSLPFPIDADKAQATFAHGIVRIVLPKAEEAMPRTISIAVGGSKQAISTGSNGTQS